jgi:hypothetical protein
MVARIRWRFRVEAAMFVVAVVLLVLTLISRGWIEEIFGVEPDGGSGALEWVIVAGFAVGACASSLLAGLEWRRAFRHVE